MFTFLSAPGFKDKIVSAVRHALITAAAFGVLLLCQSLLKMDFGDSTVLVDGLLAGIIRFVTTYAPDAPKQNQ
jgi:hypothetical protein